jgi:3-hydroxyacyl-[acyl-carrier-protein] dehydratase
MGMSKLLAAPLEWADAPVVYDLEAVQERIPQRHEMALLQCVVMHDPKEHFAIGIHDVSDTDFWVRGHIPGRPLMPGVVMVEAAAQLSAFVSAWITPQADGRLFGFAGIEDTRFRGQVVPGDRLVLMAKAVRMRTSLARFATQAFVGDKMVFEGTIIGTSM